MVKIIKNIFFKIIYFLVITYLLIFIPKIFGYNPLVIISGSMEPTLNVGGILYYEKIELNDFKINDILVYKLKDHIISHRIIEIEKNSFITKGDNNKDNDHLIINENQILGRGTNWCIPYIGYYADYIYNHKYLLFIAVLLIIIDLYFDKKDSDKNE